MRKKLLSILLSVAVAIAMIPAAGTVAFAEESNYGLYVGGEAVTWLNDYMYGYDAETNTLNLFDKRYQYDIPEEGSDIQAVIQCDHDLTIILPSYDFFSSNAIAVKVDGTLTLEPSTEHSGSCGFNGGNGNSCIIADKIINNGAISVWPTDAADVTDHALIECQEFENNGSCHLETSYVNVDTGIYCDSFVNNGTLTADTEWGYIINQAVVANDSFENNGTIEFSKEYNKVIGEREVRNGIITNNFIQNEGSILMKGMKGYGIKCQSYSHSGGDITVTINDASLADGENYAAVFCDNDASGPEPAGLEVTASNNADGTDPVAYDPAGVMNGYRYLSLKIGNCTEHITEKLAAKKATFTTNGKTEGVVCSVCGAKVKAQKTIYAAKTCTVPASKVYTGSAVKPLTIKNSQGTALRSGTDYTVTYANNTKVGKASAKVTLKGSYEGSKTLTFRILPKKAAVKGAVPGKESLKITAGTKVAATGGSTYKIAYRVKGAKSWKYTAATGQTKTIKNLKKGKVYQIKIQAMKTVNGKKYTGAWSAVKTTKKIK